MFNLDPSIAPVSYLPKPFKSAEGLKPLLRFATIEESPDTSAWVGSLLILRPLNSEEYPKLLLVDGASEVTINGKYLDGHGGFAFIRYDLRIALGPEERMITYSVADEPPRYRFQVPQIGKTARMMFFTCNGFGFDAKDELIRDTYDGIQPLWRDFMRRHGELPYHVLIGGGDQLYCDGNPHDINKGIPLFEEWFNVPDIMDRKLVEWSNEFERQAADFYFQSYAHHFQEDEFSDALATVPYNFTWDDHDVLDGFGSYPSDINDSPVMRNLGRVAQRFYLLFQNHTTPALLQEDGSLFPAPRAYNQLSSLGGGALLLAIDSRSLRTERQIVPRDVWESVWARVEATVTPQTRHMVVLTTVPTVYPRLHVADYAVDAVAYGLNAWRATVRFFRNTCRSLACGCCVGTLRGVGKDGVAASLLEEHYGQPGLRDDLIDAWTHPYHAGAKDSERSLMVLKLQDIAKRNRCRVTFVSGDVHLGGFGMFRTHGVGRDLAASDHRAMYQVVSSAIGNVPPPSAVVAAYHLNKKILGPDETFVDQTAEEMLETFTKDVDGSARKDSWLIDRRNYCTFLPQSDGSLEARLHVENLDKKKEAVIYSITVPLLD